MGPNKDATFLLPLTQGSDDVASAMPCGGKQGLGETSVRSVCQEAYRPTWAVLR